MKGGVELFLFFMIRIQWMLTLSLFVKRIVLGRIILLLACLILSRLTMIFAFSVDQSDDWDSLFVLVFGLFNGIPDSVDV